MVAFGDRAQLTILAVDKVELLIEETSLVDANLRVVVVRLISSCVEQGCRKNMSESPKYIHLGKTHDV